MNISDLYRNMGGLNPIGVDRGTSSIPSEGVKPSGPSAKTPINKTEFSALFKDQLQEAAESERGFKLSNHAAARIRSRELPWSPELEQRVRTGMDSAEAKGSREALILAGQVAVIANVPTRTVITAMDSSNLKERVFTNIDSAVLV